MARRWRRKDDEDDDELVAPAPRRRWLRVLAALLALVGLAGAFAPAIAARLGAVEWAANAALSKADVKLTVGGVGLGWWSAVELTDVKLTGADGRALLTAKRIATHKTLAGFVGDRSDLGTIVVEAPTFELHCDETSSNLERLAAKLADGPKSSGPNPRLKLVVTKGAGTILDKPAGKTWTASDLEATVASTSGGFDVDLAGKIAGGGAAGAFELDAEFGERFTANVKARDLPTEFANPWLRRADSKLALAGNASADLKIEQAAEGRRTVTRAKGLVSATNLAATAAALGDETLRLAALRLPLEASADGTTLSLNRFGLECDLGSATAAGVVDFAAPPETWLAQPGLEFAVQVDAAKTAERLPKLLRLRAGTRIEHGTLTLKAASKPTAEGAILWEGSTSASRLAGVRDGQALAWNEPLAANFAVRIDERHRVRVDKLDVRSDVLTATASGTPNAFALQAEASLDRLAERLSEFVDLAGVRLAGGAKATLVAKLADDGQAKLTGNLTLTQFAFSAAGRGVQEPSLTATIDISGKRTATAMTNLVGVAKIEAGVDRAEIRLLEPLPSADFVGGKAEVKLVGELARWRKRLGPFAGIPADWHLAGVADLTAVAALEPGAVTVLDAKATVDKLQFRGAGASVEEPKVAVQKGKLDRLARYDRKTGVTTIAGLDVRAHSVAAYVESLNLSPSKDGFDVAAVVAVNANLARVQRSLLPTTPPASAISGALRSGRIEVASKAGVYKFKVNAPLEKLRFGLANNPTWSEDAATLAAEGSYDLGRDFLTLASAIATRPDGVAVRVRGSVDKLAGEQALDLSGNFDYDLAKIEPQLRRLLGPSVRAVGKGARDFKVSGRLGESATVAVAFNERQGKPSGPNLEGYATLGWDSLRAYGFDLGKADLTARLAGNAIAADPIAATFGTTGKIRVQPTVRIDSASYPMRIKPGKIVERATLTPAVCADALGYALPVIAKSSHVTGSASLELDDNEIPLVDPLAGRFKGRLTLHNVEAGPGPVIAELAQAVGLEKTTMKLAANQTVPVRMEKGRVHHENLALNFAGLAIRTSGSVGTDGSLAMTINLPLPEKAVAGVAGRVPQLGEYLAKRRVNVPVRGTLSEPKLDLRAFQQEVRAAAEDLAKAAAEKAAEKVIDKGRKKAEEKIRDGLGKLLPFGKKN